MFHKVKNDAAVSDFKLSVQFSEGVTKVYDMKPLFASRLEISEVSVSPDGTLILYYDDDDMFWGHSVEVDARISGEMEGDGYYIVYSWGSNEGIFHELDLIGH